MTGGGEAAGLATTEPEDEGQMRSAASALCMCVRVCVHEGVHLCVRLYVSICVNACV